MLSLYLFMSSIYGQYPELTVREHLQDKPGLFLLTNIPAPPLLPPRAHAHAKLSEEELDCGQSFNVIITTGSKFPGAEVLLAVAPKWYVISMFLNGRGKPTPSVGHIIELSLC